MEKKRIANPCTPVRIRSVPPSFFAKNDNQAIPLPSCPIRLSHVRLVKWQVFQYFCGAAGYKGGTLGRS